MTFVCEENILVVRGNDVSRDDIADYVNDMCNKDRVQCIRTLMKRRFPANPLLVKSDVCSTRGKIIFLKEALRILENII